LRRPRQVRSSASGALLLLSSRSQMADLQGFEAFEAGGSRSARLKLDPASGFKSLSAHHYFTRQARYTARHGKPKALILLMCAGDRSPGIGAGCASGLAERRHEQ
jgi:hypothetical protein